VGAIITYRKRAVSRSLQPTLRVGSSQALLDYWKIGSSCRASSQFIRAAGRSFTLPRYMYEYYDCMYSFVVISIRRS